MAAKKRKRGPRHPGVVLMKPEANRRGWRARFVDPDTGKVTKETLEGALTTAEQREGWAVWKAGELAKRRIELATGATRKTGTSLSDAVDRYFKAHPQLGARTVRDYRAAAGKLVAWAGRSGIKTADDLTRSKLMGFREESISQPKRSVATGKKRGTYLATEKRRAAHSVNGELRKVRTVLGYLRQVDLLPRLSNDDLRDGLKGLPVATERIEYLKPAECRALLEAALKHDREVFDATREEHAGLRPIGSTLRYDPIAPFTACVLLTGMRLGEALALEWSQVDLDALDNEGRKVGEIHLRGSTTKTKKARTIGLEVSPALRAMLEAMRPEDAQGSVFSLARGQAEEGARRLKAKVEGEPDAGADTSKAKRLKKRQLESAFGAPDNFGWQMLRRTCGTYLTNAPGIFGAASAYRSAKQLGHSVQVAEAHYLNVARGIPRDARTLEAAMQIEEVMSEIVKAIPAQPEQVVESDRRERAWSSAARTASL